MNRTELGLDPQVCHRRNLLAAAMDRAECSRVVWLSSVQPTAPTSVYRLPTDEIDALDRINQRSPKRVRAEDIHLHYMESASNRPILDRWMFLHKSTLLNIVKDAESGFAFMNSHRTGRMSQQSELPFGRAFSGQLHAYKDPDGRDVLASQLGVYLTRGIKPNGANGPSTDDLSKMIDTGTLFDVSMGLYGGTRLCDVCGNDLYAYDEEEEKYLCNHYPGSARKMDANQIEAQKARGVPGGVATYSLVDARPGEVSAVYDGAIPGAGFGKAFQSMRNHRLSPDECDELFHIYPDLTELFKGKKMAKRVFKLSQLFGMANQAKPTPAHLRDDGDDEVEIEDDLTQDGNARFTQQVAQPIRTAPAATTELRVESGDVELRKEVEQLRADLDREKATAFTKEMTAANKIVPVESSLLTASLSQAMIDDRRDPLPAGQGRAESLRKLYSSRTPHTLGSQIVATDGQNPGVQAAVSQALSTVASQPAATDASTGGVDAATLESDRKSAEEYGKRKYGNNS